MGLKRCQLVKVGPHNHRDLISSTGRKNQVAMVGVCVYYPSAGEAETGGALGPGWAASLAKVQIQ